MYCKKSYIDWCLANYIGCMTHFVKIIVIIITAFSWRLNLELNKAIGKNNSHLHVNKYIKTHLCKI